VRGSGRVRKVKRRGSSPIQTPLNSVGERVGCSLNTRGNRRMSRLELQVISNNRGLIRRDRFSVAGTISGG
jgi:hypothetical protein